MSEGTRRPIELGNYPRCSLAASSTQELTFYFELRVTLRITVIAEQNLRLNVLEVH